MTDGGGCIDCLDTRYTHKSMDTGTYIEVCNTSREKDPPDPGFINTGISCLGLFLHIAISRVKRPERPPKRSLAALYLPTPDFFPFLPLFVFAGGAYISHCSFGRSIFKGLCWFIGGSSSVSNLINKSGV
jgi:hypothetical protein